MARNIERELNEQIKQLPSDEQRKVLDFVRSLTSRSTNGATGRALLAHAGSITTDDLAAMAKAIDKGCETVNSDEW